MKRFIPMGVKFAQTIKKKVVAGSASYVLIAGALILCGFPPSLSAR